MTTRPITSAVNRPVGTSRARIVFLIRVLEEHQHNFLEAYEQIRHKVAGGVPGHVVDQVCQSTSDPEQWLITSEWETLDDFLSWERTEEHHEMARPLRDYIFEARSLRFIVHRETAAEVRG